MPALLCVLIMQALELKSDIVHFIDLDRKCIF